MNNNNNPVLFKDPLELWDEYANFEQTDNEIYRRFLVDYWETLSFMFPVHADTRDYLEVKQLPRVFIVSSPDHGLLFFEPKFNTVYIKNQQKTISGIATWIARQIIPERLVGGMEIEQNRKNWIVEGWPDHWLFRVSRNPRPFLNAGDIVSWLLKKDLIKEDLYLYGIETSKPATVLLEFPSKNSAKMFQTRLTYFLREIDKALF